MNRLRLIVFFIAGLSLAAAAEINAQKLFYGGAPKKAARSGDKNAYYVPLAAEKLEVYKLMREAGDGDREVVFEIRRGGRTLGQIEGAYNASGASLGNFHAFYGDLDKNKSPELVIVDFNGQSLGLGVNYYTVHILTDFETRGAAGRLTFNLAEFGKDGTFIYDAKANETLILVTEWGGADIRDPKRGGGTYFTGNFFRLVGGKLKPALDKPVLARRYLNSFERERYRTDKDPRRPHLWLTSPSALKLQSDPVFDLKPASSESGVVEKFEQMTEKVTSESSGGEGREIAVSQLVVRLDSGARKTVVISQSPYNNELPGDRVLPESFGLLPAKRTLPSDLSPLLVFENLEGKRVQLNGYRPDGAEADAPLVYRLWFYEN